MDTQEERDRAVIARRKGNEARHIAAIAGTTEWVTHKPDPNDGRLPESAFDWPIYRAAIAARLAQTGDCPSEYPDDCPDLDACPVHDRGDLFAGFGERADAD